MKSLINERLISIATADRMDSPSRIAALLALGRSGGEDAFNAITAYLDKERIPQDAREAAITALGEIGRSVRVSEAQSFA